MLNGNKSRGAYESDQEEPMVSCELVRNGERVEVRLQDAGSSEPGCIVLEQEDTAIKNKIAKCSARWSMAANRDDKEGLVRWSREWAELSEKLFLFWVQLGCPKLPPSYEERTIR